MIKTLGLTLAAAGMMALTAQAVPITGSIGFTGAYSQNGGTIGNLTTATSMSITGVAVNTFATDGDFSGATLVSFATPIAVNGGVGGNVGVQLWSITDGLVTYTFDITTVSQTFTSPTQLNLAGSGTIRRDGTDDTSGTWQLGFGRSGNAFTWQSTAAANVPDGGSSLILLGSAIVGLFGFTRKSLQTA